MLDGLLVTTGFTGALVVLFWARYIARRVTPGPSFEAKFSPRGGCAEAIVSELKAARRQILVMAYSFTSDPIVDALIAAYQRGVTVEVILDRANEIETYSDLVRIMGFGVNVLIDDKHAISHNKVMLIDRAVIVTGSYNFTKQAEFDNAENIVIIKNHPVLCDQYHANFELHKLHSRKPNPKPESGTADKGVKAA